MSGFVELDQLHDHLGKLVEYYYDLPNNGAGGFLHIVLDDGNTNYDSIIFCYQQCDENKDTLGLLICDILLEIDEHIREILYLKRWGRKDI